MLFIKKFDAAAINTEMINEKLKLYPRAFLRRLKQMNCTIMPVHPTSANEIALRGIILKLSA